MGIVVGDVVKKKAGSLDARHLFAPYMSLFVPLEIVTEIVHHVLADVSAPNDNDENPASEIRSEKPAWRLIEPIVQLCHSYRLIALKLWFEYLYLKSAQDLKDINAMFPELKQNWTK